jgi:hypothetical protein
LEGLKVEGDTILETDLMVGPRAIDAYSRLSYTMWYALAEFIDNSTQSRLNYGSIVDDVLKAAGTPLVVEIDHNRLKKEITIKDNSIGMSKEDLVDALRIAYPTKDSKGRSRYGMGMKTAACWIGRRWKVVTCEWSSGQEWTADIDVAGVAYEGKKVPLTVHAVEKDEHYTHIIISDLHRNIQKKTEEVIRRYLGSMYRFDLVEGRLKILYNGQEVKAPDEYDIDTDPEGKLMRRELPEKTINGKRINGWVAVLRKGGRRFGGFSLFQEKRQIQGYPNAWRPRSIFGGEVDEGANNLISQRLMGLIEVDGFPVSHTKDAILFEGDEEEELEQFLYDFTKDYRNYAQRRRGTTGQPWSRDKIRDLLEDMKKEFASDEMKDAVNGIVLPPIDTILKNNQQQLATVTDADKLADMEIVPGLRVVVSVQEKSEYEPHLTIVAGADAGTIHVIINGLHPYYCSLESTDAVDECVRQYIYDAISEYRVSNLTGKVNPDSVRRVKNDLLRVEAVRIENARAAEQEAPIEPIMTDKDTG